MFDCEAVLSQMLSRVRMGLWCGLGDVLLLGEGNLSFSKSLLKLPSVGISKMVATTYEGRRKVSDQARCNARFLGRYGAHVLYGVDAANIDVSLGQQSFDTIVFQFPNVASRLAKYGRNANYVLIRRFLKSAKKHLNGGGRVIVTIVDTPHYHGAFSLCDAAIVILIKNSTRLRTVSNFKILAHVPNVRLRRILKLDAILDYVLFIIRTTISLLVIRIQKFTLLTHRYFAITLM